MASVTQPAPAPTCILEDSVEREREREREGERDKEKEFGGWVWVQGLGLSQTTFSEALNARTARLKPRPKRSRLEVDPPVLLYKFINFWHRNDLPAEHPPCVVFEGIQIPQNITGMGDPFPCSRVLSSCELRDPKALESLRDAPTSKAVDADYFTSRVVP